MENITLENIRVETQGYFNLKSDFTDTVNNITLRNWEVYLTEAPEIKVPRDYERVGSVWFRANNINALTLENIHVYDNGGYLSAWKDGMFKFDGCDDLKTNDVMLNGERWNYNRFSMLSLSSLDMSEAQSAISVRILFASFVLPLFIHSFRSIIYSDILSVSLKLTENSRKSLFSFQKLSRRSKASSGALLNLSSLA